MRKNTGSFYKKYNLNVETDILKEENESNINFFDKDGNKLFTDKEAQVVYVNDDSDEGWDSEVVLLMALDSTPLRMLLSGVVVSTDFPLGFSDKQKVVDVVLNEKLFNGLDSNYCFVTVSLGR